MILKTGDVIKYKSGSKTYSAKVLYRDKVVPTMLYVLKWNNKTKDYTGSTIRGKTLIGEGWITEKIYEERISND